MNDNDRPDEKDPLAPLTDAVAELLLATARRRRERLAAEAKAEQQPGEGGAPGPAA